MDAMKDEEYDVHCVFLCIAEAKVLWEAIKPYNPTILTGMPRGNWAAAQKNAWCRAHLGSDVPVITCMSAKKHVHCTHGSVLIDDREVRLYCVSNPRPRSN